MRLGTDSACHLLDDGLTHLVLTLGLRQLTQLVTFLDDGLAHLSMPRTPAACQGGMGHNMTC